MRKILNLLLILFNVLIIAQKKSNSMKSTSEFTCYLPNGEKCNMNLKGLTVGEINKKFEKNGRVWNAYLPDEELDISFKAFTMIPLFVLPLNDKEFSSDKIQEAIKMVNNENTSYIYYFGVNRFGHHWGVKADIERFIKKKILDESFLLDTLGIPSEVKDSLFGGKPARCLIYKEVGVRIYFIDGLAIGYEEVN